MSFLRMEDPPVFERDDDGNQILRMSEEALYFLRGRATDPDRTCRHCHDPLPVDGACDCLEQPINPDSPDIEPRIKVRRTFTVQHYGAIK